MITLDEVSAGLVAAASIKWLRNFPDLRQLDDPVWHDIARSARELIIPPDTELFQEGGICPNYLFVIAGSVRVHKISESGREIVLYRIESGQTCMLTTSLLLSGGSYPASGVSETETRVMVISAEQFRLGFDQSRGFRNFVCRTNSQRLCEMIMLIEAVAFGHIDVRLAELLLQRKDQCDSVEAFHKELAVELGTAREVVSRQLKEFERRGWVGLSRRKIAITDASALRGLLRSDCV